MPKIPTEREIRFEMPRGSTTTIGYNPQALARCLGGIDPLKLHFPKDRKDISDANKALIDCLCPSLYAFECSDLSIHIQMPLTKEALDDLPYVILVRITQEIIDDFTKLVKSKETIN